MGRKGHMEGGSYAKEPAFISWMETDHNKEEWQMQIFPMERFLKMYQFNSRKWMQGFF